MRDKIIKGAEVIAAIVIVLWIGLVIISVVHFTIKYW